MGKIEIDKLQYEKLLAENESLKNRLNVKNDSVPEVLKNLKNKQSQLDLILDSTKDYIAIIRKKEDGYYCESHNKAYFQGVNNINPNIKREQINGIKMTEIGKLLSWPDFVFEGIIHSYETAFETKDIVTVRDVLPTENGTLYLESTYTPIFDLEGNPDAILFTSHDITSYINTQMALKASEERFALAMDASKDGLFDMNLITGELYFSPGWKKMLGYSDDEMENISKTWEDRIKQSDLLRCKNMMSDLTNKRIPKYEIEFSMKHKDGHYIEVLSHANAVFNDKGEAIRVVGTHTDITARKNADANLRLSEERYRMIFENSPISLWEEEFGKVAEYLDVLKAKGITDFRKYFEENPEDLKKMATYIEVLDVNKATLELHKANTKEELLGNLGKTFTPSSYDAFKDEIITLAEGEKEFATQGEVKTLDGEILTVSMKYNCGYNWRGMENSNVALISLSDITDLKNTELELQKHRNNLETLVEERTRDLEGKNKQLEEFNKLFVGREFRIKELKDKLKKYESDSGFSEY